jgi:short-subunit dehydrogenase
MKRAMVTGASGGIGYAFAIELAKLGYTITAIARREDPLKALVKELSGHGHTYLLADLSESTDTNRIANEFTTNHYDLLVNNAGVGLYGWFHEVPLEKTQNMIRLNIDAVVTLSHAFLTNAIKGDSLINVASGAGVYPLPGLSAYSATKAFVTSFSETLWYEQRKKDVYVLGVLPGITETDFHKNSGGSESNNPPDALAQTPEEVVKETLTALKKRKEPTIITGAKHRAMIFAGKLLSRKHIVAMMGEIMIKRQMPL